MKKYKKFIIIGFLWLFIITIFGIGIVEAQQDIKFTPQVTIPGFEGGQFDEETGTAYIGGYIVAIYRYGVSIGAILAAVILMAAGLIWLTSGGSQDKVTRAKEMIAGSLVGLTLLFGSWIILNTINPELVDFRIRTITTISPLEVGCCHYGNQSFNGSDMACYSVLVSRQIIERLPENQENSNIINKYLKDKNVFFPNKIADTITGNCVEPVCCKIVFTNGKTGYENTTQNLCQDLANYEPEVSSSSYQSGTCSQRTLCGGVSWGGVCREPEGAVAGCFCYNGQFKTGQAERDEPCGGRGSDGAYCMTRIGSFPLFSCARDNYERGHGGIQCKSYESGAMWCCKPK